MVLHVLEKSKVPLNKMLIKNILTKDKASNE